MNNSWLKLAKQDPAWMLPEDLARRDAFGARDCGWVEQMQPFIRTYSKPDDVILDPFCGFGTTLLAAHLEQRRGIGLEVEEARVSIARERLARLNITTQEVRSGSLESEHAGLPDIQLVLTNIPYFGCSWPGNAAASEQLYSQPAYADYLEHIRQSFVLLKSIISEGGHVIVMAENVRVGPCFVPLAWEVARLLAERFVLLEEVVLIYDKPAPVSQTAADNTNRAHEYALIARKDSKPIDLDATLSCLHELVQDHPDFVVYGSFARWLLKRNLTRLPSDADLLVPNQPELLRKLVAWFERRGFRMMRWGAPLHDTLAHAAMDRAHYFRAEKLTRDGKLCLIDLCFEDGALKYADASNSSIKLGTLKVYSAPIEHLSAN
ncbi:MAG: site-specific DNA-methyltransferase [Burkholderiales bacterium]|nr:site-specific DNA-methyltransferase [Burkholderiales bacterium]